ncbi:MAG: large conductance mechanosensitive channel protein MscL [Coriobacteriaceae bacterium]|nr:large conductance mechanosensitive channel protein MscL [Coriobacteriaceae bacterium]
MKIVNEFKEFVSRGNVVDLAVAVVIGGAFTAIINSLVNDLITPLLSLLTGGYDFASLSVALGSGDNAAMLTYGAFIAAIINFLMVALVIFFLVKGINKVARKKVEEEEPAAVKDCPYCAESIAKDAIRCPRCTSILEPGRIPEELR